jgi:GT2 family glycosyltransferase
MDVSICIVNWNTRDYLHRCVQSINERTSGITYEIIVVDNASSDDSAAMLKEKFPWCKVIESPVNLGFVKGNNRAVHEASGRYVLYLNPDTKLVSNAIHEMFSFMETQKDAGAASCKLVHPDGSLQLSHARTFPTPFNQFSELVFLNRFFRKSRIFSSVEMDYWDHNTTRQVDCLSGGCIMARKEIIDALFGFDENIFMYADDVDLCYRIGRRGWKIYYLASESIIHDEGKSSEQRKEKFFSTILQRESNYYFLRKHFGGLKAWEYRLAIFLGSIVRLLSIFAILLVSKPMKKSEGVSIGTLSKYYNLLLWSLGSNRVHLD